MTASSPPTITLHDRDYNDLLLHAVLASRQGLPNAKFLLAKLRRVQLCAVEHLPAEVVSIGSRVRYQLGNQVFTRTLMLPDEAALQPDGISVATPLGTALLGLRAGDRMPFPAENGRRVITVEQVADESEDGLNSDLALDRRLDEALQETFPASDPVSVVCTACQ